MEDIKENFKIVDLEKFYQALRPNITTDAMGLVYFNTDQALEDNAMPDALIDRYQNGSAVHSNFINLKRTLTYGKGLECQDHNNLLLKEFIESVNSGGDDLDDVYTKICLDFAIFEACAVQVIYTKDGKISQIYHTDVSKLRAGIPDEFGSVTSWYYSNSWGLISNKRKRKYNLKSDAIEIPAFNPSNYEEDNYRQLLYIKRYTAGDVSEVYAIPSYFSAINWIDLDFELSTFHLNKVRNGLFPSGIMSMVGSPSEPSKESFVNNFKRKHAGASNTGKIVFIWNDSLDQAPQFIRMDGDKNDKLFDQLNDIASQKIATGHGGSLELAGIEGKGADLGGDSNKINVARSVFIQNIIKNYQVTILKGLNKVLAINGLGKLNVINEPLRLEMPIEQGDELTRDERRMMLFGFESMKVDEEIEIKDEAEVREDSNIEGE